MQTSRSIVELIGVPFEWGGRGPNNYDCWGLLMELYRRDGIDVPDVKSTNNIAKAARMIRNHEYQWRKCDLRPGVLLLFSIQGYGAHVAYFLGDDRFAHTWEDSGGVLTERLSDWEHRLLGIYEYVGEPEKDVG